VLVEFPFAQRRLNRGPNVVANRVAAPALATAAQCLEALQAATYSRLVDGGRYGGHAAACSGGSWGCQAPGRIRTARRPLAREEPRSTACFSSRFQGGSGLEGHSFGNLSQQLSTAITGSLESAINAASRCWRCRARVVPATRPMAAPGAVNRERRPG